MKIILNLEAPEIDWLIAMTEHRRAAAGVKRYDFAARRLFLAYDGLLDKLLKAKERAGQE